MQYLILAGTLRSICAGVFHIYLFPEKKMCDALNELFAEELREADLRGRTEGLKLGKSEGLHQATVETYQEMGLNYQDTCSRIKGKYQLTEDEARKIMEKHWKFT